MKLTKYNPCWCGSGRYYRDCHMPIDNAPAEQRVSAAHDVYAKSWSLSSRHFAEQGCYKWMAQKLRPYSPKRVLDIGCGTGEGILALLAEHVSEVVSLEENTLLGTQAATRIRVSGVDAIYLDRLQFLATSPQSHSIKVKEGTLNVRSPVTIVGADILTIDKELTDFLRDGPRFDAITVWLIGTHQIRHECDTFAPGHFKNSGEYRLRVQNRIYEIAGGLLRAEGVLHVVDRAEMPRSGSEDDNLGAHREQAEGTSMTVFEHDFLPYTEAEAKGSTTMVVTVPLSGRTGPAKERAMISVLAKKSPD